MPIITFTTDFGQRDWFVGTMKGVVLNIVPAARLIDITHEIPPGDIRAGAFSLAASCGYFPRGTIHVAVVDPGVGSSRQAIAVQTSAGFFVGPDNGVLSWALRKEAVPSIHLLQNEAFFRLPLSRTFQGRDLFAPVAAHIASGVPLREFGPAVEELSRLDWPEPRISGLELQGEVVYLDRFGNAITNIDQVALEAARLSQPHVFVGRKWLCAVASCYSAVPPGSAAAVVGSSGFLEIAVNGGHAARQLGLDVGHYVIVRGGKHRRV